MTHVVHTGESVATVEALMARVRELEAERDSARRWAFEIARQAVQDATTPPHTRVDSPGPVRAAYERGDLHPGDVYTLNWLDRVYHAGDTGLPISMQANSFKADDDRIHPSTARSLAERGLVTKAHKRVVLTDSGADELARLRRLDELARLRRLTEDVALEQAEPLTDL